MASDISRGNADSERSQDARPASLLWRKLGIGNAFTKRKRIRRRKLIDDSPWSGYQTLLIGTALTIVVDGLDNQLLPNAVPALIREWVSSALISRPR